MSVLNKRRLRTLREEKLRYGGIIALIILSCLIWTAMNVSGPNAKQSVQQFLEEHRVEDAQFKTMYGIPAGELTGYERQFDVVLEEMRHVDILMKDDSVLRVRAYPEKLNLPQVKAGEPRKSTGEIALDSLYAAAHKNELGDLIRFPEHQYELSSLVSMPDYLYILKATTDLMNNPDKFGFAVVNREDFDTLAGDQAVSYYAVRGSAEKVAAMKQSIHERYVVSEWMDREANPRISFINGDMNATILIGKTAPLVILLLTCCLVAIVLWRLLKLDYAQIGTLYALGYRKRTILRHYLGYAGLLSSMGGLLGTAFGWMLAPSMLKSFDIQYNLPIVELKLDSWTIGLSLLLPFVLLMPTTLFVTFRALRWSPLILMRGGGERKLGWLERRLKLDRFRFRTKFVARDLVRNLPRALLVVGGVVVASMMLLFGLSAKDSLDELMDSSVKKTYAYEVSYQFKTLQEGSDLPSGAERMSSLPAKLAKSGRSLTVYGVEENTELIRLYEEGSKDPMLVNQVVVTMPLAESLGWRVGEKIEIVSLLDSKSYQLTIDAVSDAYIADTIYMPLQQYNQMFGLPEDSYTALLSDVELDVEASKVNTILFKQDIVDSYAAAMDMLWAALGVMGGVAVLIGLIMLLVVISLVVEENKANISLLKIIGYHRREIYQLVLNTNTLLVVLGYAAAVPMTLFTVEALMNAVGEDMGLAIPAALQPLNIFIGFIVLYAAYEMAKRISRKKVLAVSMADSLKSRVE